MLRVRWIDLGLDEIFTDHDIWRLVQAHGNVQYKQYREK